MASLQATPNPGSTGRQVVIVGQGFGNALEVTFEIIPGGFRSEIVCTAGGSVSTAGIADHATVTLTNTAQPNAGEQFVLNTTTYTMRATVGTFAAANEILIGASASA